MCAFDLAWALHAFNLERLGPASTVGLLSLVLWVFLHLPASLLGSLILEPSGVFASAAEGPLPWWAALLLTALGLAQSWALSYWGACWWLGRRRA